MNDTTTDQGAVERNIVVYGFVKASFPEAENLWDYIAFGVFTDEGGRFDFSQRQDADVIVISYEGKAHGHFDVEDKVKPNADEAESGTKTVYLISRSTLYENPVPLLPLGIKGIQFGKRISEEQFRQIKALAGGMITAVMPKQPDRQNLIWDIMDACPIKETDFVAQVVAAGYVEYAAKRFIAIATQNVEVNPKAGGNDFYVQIESYLQDGVTWLRKVPGTDYSGWLPDDMPFVDYKPE